ncbi:hypothetical protein JCM10449v2_001575 [Rhodotorula kratochvilovae]
MDDSGGGYPALPAAYAHLAPQAQHQHQQQPAQPQPHPSAAGAHSATGNQDQQQQGQGHSVRPLRAMLARGAACDTCRARKVKCDASRPYCTPCLKSARGDTATAAHKCKYEGTSVAAAREAAAAAREAAGATGVKRKRKSAAATAPAAPAAPSSHDEDESDYKRGRMDSVGPSSLPQAQAHVSQHEYQGIPAWAQQQPLQHQQQHQQQPLLPAAAAAYAAVQHAQQQQQAYAPPPLPQPPAQISPPLSTYSAPRSTYGAPPPPAPMYDNGEAATAPETVPREMVEGLEGRIAELERALRHAANNGAPAPAAAQAQAPWYAAQTQAAPHTRSPSFPYASYPPAGASPFGGGAPSPFGGSGLPPPLSSSAYAPSGLGTGSPLGGGSGAFSALPPPLSLLPPIAHHSPRGDPSRRSLSALSAAAASAGMLDEAPGGATSWAAASPLSSLRGTADLAGSPRAMVSSLRGTGPGRTPAAAVAQTPGGSSSADAPGSGSGSTSGTTPGDAGTGGKLPGPTGGGAAAFELDELALTPELYALLHPQYPPSLPPIAALHHLVSTFFVRASVPATMLSRAGVLASLAYGPGDARWPDEALLHAMCAYGAMYVSPSSLLPAGALGLELDEGGRGRRGAYWEREGDASPREYHYRCAKKAIEGALEGGKGRRKMLQIVQATVLTCYVAYQNARFPDLWLYAGLATRLCTPLGLNHLDPWDFANGRCGPEGEDWGVRVRFVERRELLEPPRTVEEHWERATTWWMAFAVDRFTSASTDWSTSIDEKDISTHLPCISPYPLPSLEIDTALGLIPSLSITSPTFLDDTSAPIGSLGLYIKATVLLGRVVNYLGRLPRTKCVQQGESCSKVKVLAKSRPEFVELDVALSRFKENVGPRLYDAVGDGIDGFLISAYCIPHVATILLHEGFTDRYVRDATSSLSRCLSAAKCVVNAMHVLYGSSYDLGGNDPFLPFCWSVTGRALVRDYATRRLWGDEDDAAQAKALAESCLQFHEMCRKNGSGIAETLQKTLQRHLENPDSLLPLDATEEWTAIRTMAP